MGLMQPYSHDGHYLVWGEYFNIIWTVDAESGDEAAGVWAETVLDEDDMYVLSDVIYVLPVSGGRGSVFNARPSDPEGKWVEVSRSEGKHVECCFSPEVLHEIWTALSERNGVHR